VEHALDEVDDLILALLLFLENNFVNMGHSWSLL
jgi:hypothetical protein